MKHSERRSAVWAAVLLLFLLVSVEGGVAEAAPPGLFPAAAAPGQDGEGKTPAKKSTKKATKKKKKKKEVPRLRLSGAFALQFIFDDNIIRYSDEDLNLFTHEVNFGKFSIDTAHDWIVRPRITLALETKEITGEDLEVTLRASSWRYMNNGIKDNESYLVELKHAGFGRDNFRLSYYYSPLSYLRNFRDRAAYVSRSVPLEYHDFSYTSNSITLSYWRRLRSDLDGKLELKRSWRYFSREFMENDNWEWRFGGYLSWRFIRPLRIQAEYYYSDVLARGADEDGETRFDSNDSDPTYERDAYGLSLRFYASSYLPIVNSLNLSWTYQTYYFTTEKPYFEDPLHTGRRDLVRGIEISGDTGKILGPVSLEAGYRFTKRTSTAAWEGGADESGIGEEKDYENNRTWVGFTYPF